ncbi:sugar transferase [Micromonospora olivasterospora]|uniref:Lipopolysaccharide/colanic/teichoic acid biosynthesis glycosyltransferase n=1 Tax=Micromonospora olivasterospora TaxID=1880 RepID=A0A562IEY9_MICOL|nr:sugar transferase [Micromonospora olivasterospora]TWH69303.1 lipopolysaccharide/colanic/teichoic acid biosynthesis glycosyltransferase [Micromonospora olivasterospora]
MTACRAYEGAKRVLDVVVAAVCLVLATPVILAVAVAIMVTMGRPVLFRQPRPGRHARLFDLVKFRSMTVPGHTDGPATDAARLTPLGAWLRATSLDELPTLWNVLRGDMSLVGPRPLLPSYLDRYTPQQFRRHEVRPGVTGLQQVNGRNALTWDRRFAYDVWYVDNRGFLLDLGILARTVVVVLRREGITAPGSVTAHEFRGSRAPAVVGAGVGAGEGRTA